MSWSVPIFSINWKRRPLLARCKHASQLQIASRSLRGRVIFFHWFTSTRREINNGVFNQSVINKSVLQKEFILFLFGAQYDEGWTRPVTSGAELKLTLLFVKVPVKKVRAECILIPGFWCVPSFVLGTLCRHFPTGGLSSKVAQVAASVFKTHQHKKFRQIN